MRKDSPEIDVIIERALRGEATERELAVLAEWRRASLENELHYGRAQRLLEATRGLRSADTLVPPRPSAATIAARVQVSRADSAPARLSRALLRWAPWPLAAAAALLVVLQPRADDVTAAWAPAEIVTGAAEMATVKLGDGSVVRLAPSSRLQFDAARTREVTLDGRAFFAVAKADGQPFRVHTHGATANVLGTRFELAADSGGVRLSVLEGRVALAAPENSVEVGAGEQSGVRHRAATAPAPIAASDSVFAWLGRFLVFQTTPLRDAAREIERMYDVRVVVDQSLLDATITAAFTDRTAEDVLSVVCAVLNAQCTWSDRAVSMTR